MLPDFKQNHWRWIIAALCGVYCLFEVDGKGDFFIFLSAADDLAKHVDIFEKTYVNGYHYYYSVFFAIILKPFVALPFHWVKYFWILLNALLFFDLMRMLLRSPLVQVLENKKQSLFMILVFAVSMRFFRDNIHTSQITILILWLCIKGLHLISQNTPLTGSFLLALGINIKLFPLVFIPYLIYRGYFKAVFYCIAFYFLMMFLPSLIIGHEYNLSLLSTWFKLINPSNQIHILDVDERSFHGLSTLLSTLLVKNVPDVYALEIPRNIADVSLETLSKIILVVRLALAAFTLYFLNLKPFRKAGSGFQQCIEISYLLLLIPLVFPHQQHYAFLFAIPAFAVLLYSVMAERSVFKQKQIIAGMLIFIAIVFNLKLLLGVFNAYYDHFKIITYCALLLIPMLVVLEWRVRKSNYLSP